MPVNTDLIVKTLIQHRSELIGYAWVVVGDSQAAEDVFQDVSLAAVKKAGQIDDAAHLRHWLRRAIRLRGLEVRRARAGKARQMQPEVLDLLEQAQTPLTLLSESEQMEALQRCMKTLNDRSHRLLDMRYGREMDPAEIAAATGSSLAAVRKAITRIHGRLRDCVKHRLSITEDAS